MLGGSKRKFIITLSLERKGFSILRGRDWVSFRDVEKVTPSHWE